MKKTAWFLLSLMAIPLHAQSLLGTLNQHQSLLEPDSANGGSPAKKKPDSEVIATSESSSVNAGKCEENDQTSLPLSYITSLVLHKDGKLDVEHDPRKGTLQISSPSMINNCSNMVQFKMKEQVISGSKVYAVEAKLKEGENCDDNGCEYKVARMEGSAFKEWEKMKLKPTLKGFEECLKKSGVIDGTKVNTNAIYSTPLQEKFTDVYDSGKVLFVSHGPSSAQVKAKYGKFDTIDKCDHYENINAESKMIVSAQDAEKQQLDAEASELKKCSINEYHKVSDFIEKYEGYAEMLGELRDRLILEASKKSATAMDEGKYTEEDLKVMADFDKYIVLPRINKARALYAELQKMDVASAGAATKKKELQVILDELKSFNGKPYFAATHVRKLIADGRFEDSDKMNTMKLSLDAYSKLGTKTNGVVVTPDVAQSRVGNSRAKFQAELETEKENYALRTGEVSGKEKQFQSLASRMRANIGFRTENFTVEIQEEYKRMQQGGYCYVYFRNTQKCIQDSTERIQELQALLKHYNKVDSERAAEYDEEAKKYGVLEAEGRRYIAAQNGEEAPAEVAAPAAKPVDTTLPTPRANPGTYQFGYNPQQQGGQQGMPQGYNPQGQQGYAQQVQQNNPFSAIGGMFAQAYGQSQGGYQQQPPYMGQQAYGYPGMYGNQGGGSYNFNWGGGQQQQTGGMMGGMGGFGQPMGGYGQQMGGYGQQMGGYGQQQQSGFWGQPYQAYNNYSMYGR